MKGKYTLVIENRHIKYELCLERNVTIIKGNSGTGKSTLVDMFRQIVNKQRTGIKCNMSDKLGLLEGSTNWKSVLTSSSGKIFIADEDVEYVKTFEFAKVMQSSDNYFIFITRTGMISLFTYSVSSVYELNTSNIDVKPVTRLYKRFYNASTKLVKPDLVITEDSNSGYEMFSLVLKGKCDIVSAKGKDNVYNLVKKYKNYYNCICVVVDGAAFGGCIGRFILWLGVNNSNLIILAPESFEYLLLKDKTFSRFLTKELSETYNYCDSKIFISWERYYTYLIENLCKERYRIFYAKSTLGDFFKTKYFINYIHNWLKSMCLDL